MRVRAGMWLTVPAFTVLYVLAGLLGRATAIEDRSLSLVWPATGIGVLWFLTLVGRKAFVASAALLVAATVVVSLVTRPTPQLVVIFVVAHLAQVVAVVLLVRRWCPELGVRGGRPPLETPAGLVRFLGASALGCAAGLALGVAGLVVAGVSFAPISALAWWGRNVCGVLAVTTIGLLLIRRLIGSDPSPSGPLTRARAIEIATVVGTTLTVVGLDAASGLPFAFMLPATTVWAGLRFSPLVVSAHAGFSGIAVIWLTLTDHGPFVGAGSVSTHVLLAELFVAMTIMIGLLLAAGRQESLRLQSQLHARQQDLAAFARRAAHDLQSPLLIIEGWAGLLGEQLAPGSERSVRSGDELEKVRRIQGATKEMRGLVRDLLADATTQDLDFTAQRVDLVAIVQRIAEARDVRELVQVGQIPPVAGDPAMVTRLVDNLIGNSLKYVAPGEPPCVEVSAEIQRAGMVAVRVADRGVGIPSGLERNIFDEFSRAHGETYPGTGLGLSICRRIVERHGGDIVAFPRRPGPGTVIEFRLPGWESDDSTTSPQGGTTPLVSSERALN